MTSVVALAVVAAIASAAFVLGRRATRIEPIQPQSAAPAIIKVRSGTLEETRPIVVSMQWQEDRPLFNQFAGTITASGVSTQSATVVSDGTVLYSVDRRPVIVIDGAEPAYRSIETGAKGPDVEWVQRFLEKVGLTVGPIDGKWGAASTSAWKSLQRFLGLAESASVPFGQVIFIPDLPRRIAPTEALTLGAALSGGEPMSMLLAPTPTVFAEIPTDLAAGLPLDALVDIDLGSEVVIARATDRRTSTSQGVRVELEMVLPACGGWCNAVPIGETAAFSGLAHVTSPVTGVIVPVGALRSGPNNSTVLVLADGSIREVEVLAKVGAEAVVEGIPPDAMLQLGESTSKRGARENQATVNSAPATAET